MSRTRVLELAAALARDPNDRARAAGELARHLGAEDLLLLTPETEHAVYLPPCGFPQTLFQNRRWKTFIGETESRSQWQDELCYPSADRARVARGWLAADKSILLLFDGAPDEDRVRTLLDLLPLMAPSFGKERHLITMTARAKLSAQAAHQARVLAEALDEVRRQLQATVILRERDIAERARVEEQLEQSNLHLTRVNEDLKQFTFAATHDIREPLRMMTIYVQLLQQELEETLSPTAKDYIRHVLTGGRRLSRLIDGLLQFTRLGERDLPEPVAVDAAEALREALDDLRISAAESSATIQAEPLPVVMADPLHLRQVFQNLVGNALKYRRPAAQPEIGIRAAREGEFWRLFVRDNGMGVAPEHHEQIFLPFKRLHGSEITGAGIGLATCKRIVERYGGSIRIDSEENGGAEFSFTLPAADGRHADAPGMNIRTAGGALG